MYVTCYMFCWFYVWLILFFIYVSFMNSTFPHTILRIAFQLNLLIFNICILSPLFSTDLNLFHQLMHFSQCPECSGGWPTSDRTEHELLPRNRSEGFRCFKIFRQHFLSAWKCEQTMGCLTLYIILISVFFFSLLWLLF